MMSEEQQHSSDENNAFRGGSDSSQIKQVRLVQPDRRQLSWTMLDVERLVDEDHPVRAIWELAGRLDLSCFSAAIGSLEGAAGRPAYDPRLLISLWIYAYSRGIGSAREVERRCEHDPAFRWLTGLLVINHHTLSDFRLAHRDALDWHCHVRPFYLLIARGAQTRMSKCQCLRMRVAELNRLENRLFLANVTMPVRVYGGATIKSEAGRSPRRGRLRLMPPRRPGGPQGGPCGLATAFAACEQLPQAPRRRPKSRFRDRAAK
jgi:hypothetical protein